MESVIRLTQNLTQQSTYKLVGSENPLQEQNFEQNLTVFLITILVALTSAPFFMILIGLVMYSGKIIDSNSERNKNEIKKSTIKAVPFTSFIWIFIQMRTDIPKIIKRIVRRYGLAFKLNILYLIRIICVNDPVMLKKLDLFTEPVHLHKPSWYHKIMPNFIKNDSSTTPGQREALLQAFNNKNLSNHLKTFERHSEKIRSYFQEDLKYNTDKGSKANKIFDRRISKYAFDTFADICFGSEVYISPNEKLQLFELFERVKFLSAFCFNHHFTLPNFLWALHPVKLYMDRTLKKIFTVVNKIAQNTKPENAETKSASILDISGKSLIEVMSKAGLSNEEVSAEVIAFMAWGHGTISTTLSKLMVHLADKREYQNKCQQEINEMFRQIENISESNAKLSKEALNGLKCMDRCIQECLRLYPVFPLFGRTLQTTVQLDENITISAGTKVLTCHWLVHRNSDNFPNPETFNPDRFLPENLNKNVHEYMTCSLSPTNCIWQNLITQQIKVFASHILHDFVVYTDKKAETLKKYEKFFSYKPTLDVKLRKIQ